MPTGIAHWIGSWARLQPDRPLLTFRGRTTTWAEFDRRVDALARGLHRLGVGRGDRVACLMHNRPEFLELFWATVRLGALFAPVNVRLAPPELQYVISDLDPAVIATEEAFAPTATGLQGSGAVPGGAVWLSADPTPSIRATPLDALPVDGPLPAVVPEATDPAAVLYTSGTTGRPKGAVLSHGNIHAQAANWVLSFGLTRTDRQLMFLPLCFTGGLISASMNTFYSGASMVLEPDFDPAALLADIERERPTWFTAVPAMMQRLFEHPDAPRTDLSSLTMIESGGAAVPVPLIEKVRGMGLELIQGYGITEGSGGVNLYLQEWEGTRKPGSCGKAGGVYGDARIVRPDGTECDPGEIGELLIDGPLVFQGYWRNDAATAETLVDGWLHTGDLARFDEEGFVYLSGRLKEMINSGGLNVYPAEVEAALVTLPDVSEVAVVGLPDERWGQVVAAFVVPRPGTEPDPETIRCQARALLADYKVPKTVCLVDDLPRTTSNKVLKRVLVEQATRDLAVSP
ncbi:class I adenylate-forming enzyme family protein [Pseudonocardia sp. RS010]|uniref:class I adenylate-forming enzyme family protein n=1 Tax=Pseudonocardia sp. RS010 TaxID=3385979 RepID=UPI0039A15991